MAMPDTFNVPNAKPFTAALSIRRRAADADLHRRAGSRTDAPARPRLDPRALAEGLDLAPVAAAQ
jgi:hypothetical protein